MLMYTPKITKAMGIWLINWTGGFGMWAKEERGFGVKDRVTIII